MLALMDIPLSLHLRVIYLDDLKLLAVMVYC